MRYDPTRSGEAVAWTAARIAHMRGAAFQQHATGHAIVDARGAILGAIVFSNWQPAYGTVTISAAADDARWLSARAAIDQVFDYAFGAEGLDANKVFSATAASNVRTLKVLQGWGFKREAVLEQHFGGEDAVMCRLFRAEFHQLKARRRACLR